jgi:hypothetical protein
MIMTTTTAGETLGGWAEGAGGAEVDARLPER